MVCEGDGFDNDAEDWAELSFSDLEADLKASEETSTPTTELAATSHAAEDHLRSILQKGSNGTSAASFNADIFFAAHRALDGIAAELQEVLVQVEMQQFDAASLVASLVHGPLQPPVQHASDTWVGLPADKVFGLAAAPAAPPPLELSKPAGASSLQDYERRAKALPHALFLSRELRLCVGDVDRRQDQKDIGRDELVVNGQAISGAKGGYEEALATVAAALRAGDAAAWPAEADEHAAQLFLSVLNRTCSGFAAFEEVLRLFNCHDVVIVSPESAAARPLEAVVLGGVALGHAHTRYAVRRADDGDSPLTVVDAVFVFRIATSTLRRLAIPEDVTDGRKRWPAEEISEIGRAHV